MLDAFPAWAAEFPNDNPALHEGVSWVCLSVCGPVKPVMRPKSVARPLASVAALVAPADARVIDGPRRFTASERSEPADRRTGGEVAEASLGGLRPPVTQVELPEAPPASPGENTRADFEQAVETPSPAELVVAAARAEPAEVVEERLPESVLGELLEKLTLDLTPARSMPVDDVLDIDASDLDGTPAVEAVAELVMEAAPAVPEVEVAVEASPEAPVEAPQTIEITVISSADEPALAAPKSEPAPSADAPDDYAAFVSVLVDVLLAHGATRAGAVLPSLLSDGSVDASLLDRDTVSALAAGKIANESEGSVRLRDEFVVLTRAWQDVLRGTTQDLGACGTTTLDGWASDLVRAMGVGREGRVDVRRELRKRGVAAFGMLRAA